LNEEMYLKICDLSGNEFLLFTRKLINNQLGRYKPLRLFLFNKPNAIARAIEEEKALLDAIKKRNNRKFNRLAKEKWIHFLSSEEDWVQHEKSNK